MRILSSAWLQWIFLKMVTLTMFYKILLCILLKRYSLHHLYEGYLEKSQTDRNQFSSVQSLSYVWVFAIPWNAACQASLSITNSRSSPRLTSIESVMPSSHLILCHPLFLCPQSLPASESFPMSQRVFAWGGQSSGVSALASFLPKKSQGWSPTEWTCWLSLQSKGLSRVFLSYKRFEQLFIFPGTVFEKNTTL